VAYPAFGEKFTITEVLTDLLKTAPILCPSDVAILLRDRYETTYGIFNHEQLIEEKPLALVAMQWSENSTLGCTLYERIEQFKEFDVGKHFNISIKDFFDLPSDVCRKLIEVSKKSQGATETAAQEVLKDLENSIK
jgi:hypothetical protein